MTSMLLTAKLVCPSLKAMGLRGNKFTGEMNWVQIASSADATVEEHSITDEERLLVAMAM